MGDYDRQSGNVLFIVLIAVALFAALSYAITQSGRGGGDTNREQSQIRAAQIAQFVSAVEQAVSRLRIAGCSETEINFDNTTVSGYTNPSAPVDGSCDVFGPNGGGLTYVSPDASYLDSSESAKPLYGEYWFTATNKIVGIGTEAANSTAPDARELVVYLNWVTQDLCEALNKGLDYPMPTGDPPVATGTRWDGAVQKFVGVYGPEYSYNVQADGTGPGHWSGCWQGQNNPAGGYHFYHVLIAR